MKAKSVTTEEINVLEISQGQATFGIVGTTPLIMNRLAEKARRELLKPTGRKSAADRAGKLKHDPIEEYRSSVYRNDGDSLPTRLKFPAPGLKEAMASAALDLPGIKKTEIGRLTWVTGTHVNIFGVPQLFMTPVRSADIAKTPDIRTRAIIPQWACIVTINFVQPKVHKQAVGHLLAAAGIIAGIGDFRQGKGKGSFGQFHLVDQTDEDFLRISAEGGREAQDAALADPQCYDGETEELLSWFTAEVVRLYGKKEVA